MCRLVILFVVSTARRQSGLTVTYLGEDESERGTDLWFSGWNLMFVLSVVFYTY
jgi:hypothetical protein